VSSRTWAAPGRLLKVLLLANPQGCAPLNSRACRSEIETMLMADLNMLAVMAAANGARLSGPRCCCRLVLSCVASSQFLD
jgi:hypothetical protein